MQKSFVEDLNATESLIYGFYLFENKSFLDLLEIKHGFKEGRVLEFKKEFKALDLINAIDVPIGSKMIKKFFIEKYFAINMLRHLLISILDEVNG